MPALEMNAAVMWYSRVIKKCLSYTDAIPLWVNYLLRKAHNFMMGCKHFAFFLELAHPEPAQVLRLCNMGMS